MEISIKKNFCHEFFISNDRWGIIYNEELAEYLDINVEKLNKILIKYGIFEKSLFSNSNNKTYFKTKELGELALEELIPYIVMAKLTEDQKWIL